MGILSKLNSIKNNNGSSVLAVLVDQVQITNTSVESSVMPLSSSRGTKTILADTLQVGDVIRITGTGVYGTPLVGTDVTIRTKANSVVLSEVVTDAIVSNAANDAFTFTLESSVMSLGVSGEIVSGGNISYQSSSGRILNNLDNNGVPVTVDTTQDIVFDVTLQWDSASTDRNVVMSTCTLELLRPPS